MQISIRGEDPELREELKQAMVWFLHHLVSPSILKNVKIKIKVVSDLYIKERYKGSIIWTDKNHQPRSFFIDLDKDLSKTCKINVLAHECVHLKQFAEGYLKDLTKPELTKWHDKRLDSNKIPYRRQPWEIEARAGARILASEYRKYLQTLK